MEGLNYHHLLYFRVVAREGSIARAAEKLKLSQPTISEQIRTLEEQTGTALFTRQGRRLSLTDAGRTALHYAEEIHTLGDQLVGALREQPPARQQKLTLAVADGVPPGVAAKVAAAFTGPEIRCILKRGTRESLDEVTAGTLDIFITDAPPTSRARLVVQKIATLPVTVAATSSFSRKFKVNFPHSLDGAPLLMPSPSTRLGRAIEDWLDRKKIRPVIIAESTDAAPLEAVALEGRALLACAGDAPHGLSEVGRLDRVRFDLYLVANARGAARVKAASQALGRMRRHAKA